MPFIENPTGESLPHPRTVLILGASARAAAWSALRAGLAPAAADLFADRDLTAIAPCRRVERDDYPAGLIAAATTLPAGPWFYTGALENRPDLIARIAESRPLWGNGAESVRAARDPIAVAEALRSAGLPAAEVRLDPIGLPRDGSWLRKPLDSAGGSGIERLRAAENLPAGRSFYYQKRVHGPSLSAVFVGVRGGSVLAGLTRQLIGRPGSRFAYRGNVTPWPVDRETTRRIEAVGTTLAARFGLVGLFGIDFVLGRDGDPRVVEINPRYTASVEVLELSLGRSLLEAHRLACQGQALRGSWPPDAFRAVAKEVIHAGSAFVFDGNEDDIEWDANDPFRVPRAADLPHPGTSFAKGAPILTVFGSGETPADALRDLAREREARALGVGFL